MSNTIAADHRASFRILKFVIIHIIFFRSQKENYHLRRSQWSNNLVPSSEQTSTYDNNQRSVERSLFARFQGYDGCGKSFHISGRKITYCLSVSTATEAPSTRNRIFLNLQLFLSRIQKFPRPHVTYSNRIRLSTRIRWYPDSLQRNQAYMLCRHIGLLFSQRLDTILLRCRIRKYPDSPSTRYRIRCGFIFFHSGEQIQKYPDSLPNSPDVCGRKPYSERKRCGFKNIRIRVYGA